MAKCNKIDEQKRAHECKDQLPLINHVGRGIKGDAFKVTCHELGDNQDHTVLKGWEYDEATKTWSSEPVWISDNINGGRLKMWYRLNVMDIPNTFTQTWSYEREGRTEWHWISPAIPYIYYPEPIIGSDAATVYLKDHMAPTTDAYKEMLTYPADAHDRDVFHTPTPPGGKSKKTSQWYKEDAQLTHGSAWGVNLDIIEFDEQAKITGLTETQLKSIIRNPSSNHCIEPSERETEDWDTFDGIKSDNIKDFIEDMAQAESTARGTKDRDLQQQLNATNERIRKLEQYVYALSNAYDNVFESILGKFYGGGTLNKTESNIPSGDKTPTKVSSYSVTFPNNNKAAVGNINVYGWPGGSESNGGSIMTHPNGPNAKGDIMAE